MGLKTNIVFSISMASLFNCSSAPIKVQCSEIQGRIDYGDLTSDQLRFAMQELEECKNRQLEAEKKDSSFIDRTEKRFTPPNEGAPEDLQDSSSFQK